MKRNTKSNKKIERETLEFISLTTLVPDDWMDWFYGAISENAPFSWGDNNRTLVTASRFCDHCESVFEDRTEAPQKDLNNFLKMLEGLGETYIDLEN